MYLKYLQKYIRYQHPRLSYYVTEETQKLNKFNAFLVYSILLSGLGINGFLRSKAQENLKWKVSHPKMTF